MSKEADYRDLLRETYQERTKALGDLGRELKRLNAEPPSQVERVTYLLGAVEYLLENSVRDLELFVRIAECLDEEGEE